MTVAVVDAVGGVIPRRDDPTSSGDLSNWLAAFQDFGNVLVARVPVRLLESSSALVSQERLNGIVRYGGRLLLCAAACSGGRFGLVMMKE